MGGRRVLVTGGDYTGPLAAVRALRSGGYEPWVVSTSRKAYAARSRAASRHLVLPDARHDSEGFIDGILRAHGDAGFHAILGGTERDLLVIARNRDRFGSLASTLPEVDALRKITDKRLVNELAEVAGLRVPPTISPCDRGPTLADVERMPTPWLLKPLRSEAESAAGGFQYNGVRRINSLDEFRAFTVDPNGPSEWLAQAYIDGELGAICGIAWEGKIVCAVHQRSKRTWPEELGISAYAVTTPPNVALEDELGRLVKLLGWSGIFQAQFIHSEECSYLIDLNPRVYGSLALAVKAGMNLPAIWMALVSGTAYEIPTYGLDVRYRCEELDALALRQLLWQQKRLKIVRELLPRRQTAHAVGRLSDPLPMLTSLAKLRRLVNPLERQPYRFIADSGHGHPSDETNNAALLERRIRTEAAADALPF
jgi:predicted ATP-grasp superfamily ATP-dependent carboligase